MTVAGELQEVSDADRKANPCLYDEQFKEFDFWITGLREPRSAGAS